MARRGTHVQARHKNSCTGQIWLTAFQLPSPPSLFVGRYYEGALFQVYLGLIKDRVCDSHKRSQKLEFGEAV